MSTLGGSIFTHNAVKFDYCIREAIASLCAICDDVVVLDAESDDGTQDVLKECRNAHANLRVYEDAKWNCVPDYGRLAILANEAKSHLKTQWHFMLQADEVIHEKSFPYIKAVLNQNVFESFFVRRVNLFGDLNHFLHFGLPQEKKPCSDAIVRMALTKYNAVGDAESIGVDPHKCSDMYMEKVHVFHYGFVRRDASHIQKVIDMQSWFYGPGSQPDSRVVAMKDGVYDWRQMKLREDLKEIPLPHPRFARAYAEERQREKTIPLD